MRAAACHRLILVAFIAAAPVLRCSAGSRPNVVLLIVDTLRADKLGCYGHADSVSPELDAIAAQGVRFADVLAPSSWTRPSIGAMLTGRHPRTLGLYDVKNEILNSRFTTLAEALRSQGYTTLGATANPVINSAFNMHQGFDEYVDSVVVFPWMRDEVYAGEARSSNREASLPSARQIFATATEMIERRDTFPFYVQLNIMEMHESWRGRKSLTRAEIRKAARREDPRGYLAALRQVSIDVNAFIRELRARDGWENTVFVITSDHGQGLNDHPGVAISWAHGRLLYESHLKVPLIFHHPGTLTPRVVNRPVRLVDLTPTLLDYLGIEAPGGLDGVSLAPLMTDGRATVSLPGVFMAETYWRKNDKIAAYGAEWKYIENRHGHWGCDPEELQRMGGPENGKRTNDIEESPAEADVLRAYLDDWERHYPKAEPTPRVERLSERETSQLTAIGYLD